MRSPLSRLFCITQSRQILNVRFASGEMIDGAIDRIARGFEIPDDLTKQGMAGLCG